MSDTPETDGITFFATKDMIPPYNTVPAEFARKLERERDDAREDAADWKVEYEIVAARLRGEKHPQDNGIIAKDEIIPKLIRERDVCMGEIERLKRKINEAVECKISAIESWDEERKRAIREGERVVKEREKYFAMRALSNNATELAEKYKQERDEAREALQSVMDWNPKPTSCAACWTALPARFNADMARAWKILEATK